MINDIGGSLCVSCATCVGTLTTRFSRLAYTTHENGADAMYLHDHKAQNLGEYLFFYKLSLLLEVAPLLDVICCSTEAECGLSILDPWL